MQFLASMQKDQSLASPNQKLGETPVNSILIYMNSCTVYTMVTQGGEVNKIYPGVGARKEKKCVNSYQ